MTTLDSLVSVVMGLVGCIGAPLFVLAFVVGAVRWTAGPVLEAAGGSRRPRTFLLTDLIWLMVQMQLAMGLASYAFPAAMPTEGRVVAMVLLCVPVILFWLASLLLVSQAGILRPFRRAAVFVVLLPGVALTVLGLPLLTLGLLHALGQRNDASLPSHSSLVVGLQFAVLAAFSLSLRWLARWVISPV
jgi:hypothetical protein